MKKEKTHFRNCPKCDKKLGHVSAASRDRAVSVNRQCVTCSRSNPFSAERKANISAAMKGVPLSKKRRAKLTAYLKSVTDAYTEMYGDKFVFEKYNFNKWAKQVKERDSYTCQKCAKVASGKAMHAHHIVPKAYFMARALDIDNGISLCSKCHRQVHCELNTYTLKGVKFSATDFQNHLIGFKPNGKK